MRGAALLRRSAGPEVPPAVPHGEELLSARGLSVAHGEREVLRDVELQVRAGELVALVGPNGAGKSTLLGALTGDLHPSDGQLRCFGRDLGEWSPGDLARRRAVLPQQVTVSFPFTVHEVVRMGRAPWARTHLAAEDDRAVLESIAAVDLAHLASRPFTTLSGGERARAALARVLAQQAQLLLLDEPTAALDLHHQELVFELLVRRVADGAAVVVVVHDLALAAAFADRVLVLEQGRIAADGPPRDVLTAGLLSRVYRHDLTVVAHPLDGSLLVAPSRRAPAGRSPLSHNHHPPHGVTS